ncbi:MAG: hypothetical protein MJ166_04165 [Clostridia bacterium]|nr:hypothetical protein [Clostridia bacterium]
MLEAVEYDRIVERAKRIDPNEEVVHYDSTPLTAEQEMARFEREQKAKRSDGESASSFASPFAPADKQYALDMACVISTMFQLKSLISFQLRKRRNFQ